VLTPPPRERTLVEPLSQKAIFETPPIQTFLSLLFFWVISDTLLDSVEVRSPPTLLAERKQKKIPLKCSAV
jgi:hypothetical protein